MRIKNLLYVVLILGMVSCKNSEKTEKPISKLVTNAPEVSQESSHKGKELMEAKCYVCHGPDASEDARIAPPMAAIKARYMMGNPSKEEFGNAFWNFVKKPTMDKGKMKGALKRFGVMPYQPFSEADIKLISDFMYEYKIEEPSWFKEHWEKGHGKGNYKQQGKVLNSKPDSPIKPLKETGLDIARSTQKVLGKNLMEKMQNEGPVAALHFCNENAYPLTDSMATVHQAKIKRVSDKARNPLNQANQEEMDHIAYFKKKVEAQENYDPIVIENGDQANFYYPIVTNNMCLKCHGKLGKDVGTEVASMLRERYPTDAATGYTTNEIRGIWSIELPTNMQN